MHVALRRLVLALALVAAVPLAAQTLRGEMLVSTGWLQHHLASVKVLHIGTRADYDAGHVPGAVLVEMSSLLAQRDGTPNELPMVEQLESVFRATGVGGRGRIVLISNDPLFAARAWFTLDYLGHGGRAAILDGGFAKWKADGLAVSLEPVAAKNAYFAARANRNSVTRFTMMTELIRMRDQLGPNLVLIDARPPAQFGGDEAGADVKRAGHIPGAINIPVPLNFRGDGTFAPPDQLASLYRNAGVMQKSANIAYCRTGMQASVTYFVLKYLGYDASLYDGSYIEWSGRDEPTES